MTALAPVADRLHCTWVGWLDGGLADTEVETRVDGTRLVSVDVAQDTFDAYYLGFANQVLWPLFHGLPEFVSATDSDHDAWFAAYAAVNRAFAERIAEVARPDSLVWVQDYHLMLVPQLLRELRPDLRIAFFLHIPFPDPDVLAAEPWASELIAGLSFADLVGVQRERDAEHLREAVRAQATGEVDVRSFPISIDAAPVLASARDVLESGVIPGVRARFGAVVGALERQLLLGVDRLDYTKGILERVEAFEAVLDGWRAADPPPVLVQVLAPTRESIAAYRDYADRVSAAIARVNERFGAENYTPIVTLPDPVSHAELAELYLAADVMCVTPLRDGMNLVAKEFVVSRLDERGVLLLSEGAGAADELVDAVVVDPSSPEHLAAGMLTALTMPTAEAERRMRLLRARVLEHDVHVWAREFLRAAGV